MFYVKNVPNRERALRVIVGMAALAFPFAVMHWGVSVLAIALGIVGAMLAMTGLFGFCPMCAMVGRKLDQGH